MAAVDGSFDERVTSSVLGLRHVNAGVHLPFMIIEALVSPRFFLLPFQPRRDLM